MRGSEGDGDGDEDGEREGAAFERQDAPRAMGQQQDHERASTWAAVSAAACVAVYVAGLRGLRVSLAEFAACAALLLAALALLLRPQLLRGALERGGALVQVRERFDDMVAITQDLLSPRLDKLIAQLSGNSGATEPQPRAVVINKAWFGASAADAGEPTAVQDADVGDAILRYKRIGILLCHMSEAAPERFAAMLQAVGAPAAAESTADYQFATEQADVRDLQKAAASATSADRRAAVAASQQKQAQALADSDRRSDELRATMLSNAP